jgi:hypothetical protein
MMDFFQFLAAQNLKVSIGNFRVKQFWSSEYYFCLFLNVNFYFSCRLMPLYDHKTHAKVKNDKMAKWQNGQNITIVGVKV